jgi:hypothetical protein
MPTLSTIHTVSMALKLLTHGAHCIAPLDGGFSLDAESAGEERMDAGSCTGSLLFGEVWMCH